MIQARPGFMFKGQQMTTKELRLAILSWARTNGILTENVPIEEEGNINLVPFESDDVEFFRTRKIVRIDDEKEKITIFSRLPIAKTKKAILRKKFDRAYGQDGIQLVVDNSKPWKIDHVLDTYGPFEPLRKNKGAICCGSSIGLGNQRNAGTLTALARDVSGTLFGLSCNHVIGGCSIAQPGTPVVSPGIQDVSAEHKEINVIGIYALPAQMAQGLPSVSGTGKNRDLACFQISKKSTVSSLQGTGDGSYDTPTTFATSIHRGMPVKKWGRSTGLTDGVIEYIGKGQSPEPIDYNIICYYGPMYSQVFKGTVYYDRVYTVAGSPFSVGGDSGALVVTDNPSQKEEIVGVVIAGGSKKSILLPIKPALKELKLELVSGHNV